MVSRRDLIKAGAAAATGAALGQGIVSPAAAGAANQAALGGGQRTMRAAQMRAYRDPLRVVDIPVPETIEAFAARSLFAREVAEVLPVLEQEVTATLQPSREGDEFVMPSQAHLVQARAS